MSSSPSKPRPGTRNLDHQFNQTSRVFVLRCQLVGPSVCLLVECVRPGPPFMDDSNPSALIWSPEKLSYPRGPSRISSSGLDLQLACQTTNALHVCQLQGLLPAPVRPVSGKAQHGGDCHHGHLCLASAQPGLCMVCCLETQSLTWVPNEGDIQHRNGYFRPSPTNTLPSECPGRGHARSGLLSASYHASFRNSRHHEAAWRLPHR